MNEEFSDKEIALLKLLGLEEEIDEADDFCETLDLLPDDVDSFFKRIKEEIPNEKESAINKIIDIFYNDRPFYNQIIAFFNLLQHDISPKVEKVSSKQLEDAQIKEYYLPIVDEVKQILNNKS